MYKQDLALNNYKGWYAIKPSNLTIFISFLLYLGYNAQLHLVVRLQF